MMDVRSTRGDLVRSQSISTSVSPWRISPSLAGRVAFHHGLLRLLIVVGLGSPVYAQIGAGALAGQVVDQAGAGVAGGAGGVYPGGPQRVPGDGGRPGRRRTWWGPPAGRGHGAPPA